MSQPATVTQAAPLPQLRAYIVHGRTDGHPDERVTVHVHAVNQSRALAAAGLPAGSVHDAKFTACDACYGALGVEAVTR